VVEKEFLIADLLPFLSLLFSPLVKDKLFGLPLGKLQEEVSKTPQTVKVDVQVSKQDKVG
jgi:hypothetical protein